LYSIAKIPHEKIHEFWPMCAPLLERGVEESRGRFDIESLRQQVFSGIQFLWIIIRDEDKLCASFTTQFMPYPRKLMLAVVFCGSDDSIRGSSDVWGEKMNDLKEWAAMNNCDGVELVGRRGWTRLMKGRGFDETYVTIESEV